jgi:hypothetical protein
LERHGFQERGFTRAGLADDVDVGKAVFVLDAKDAFVALKIHAREARNMIRTHTGAYLPLGWSSARDRKFCRDSDKQRARVSVRLASVRFVINVTVTPAF